ncbi:MAG: autoinducer 2 ABC transporter substrate-binding protein [Paenibacillaceae bacterium]|nr:MAG: autoinducer 2 ABC transporter substrate-binding protein [Paenibacillaceae bacterium]
MARVWLAAVFVVLLTLASACSPTGDYQILYDQDEERSAKERHPDRQYTIAVVPKREGLDYFEAAKDGAFEAAKELGINVLFRGPETADADAQIRVIEELIEQDIDLLAVSSNDPKKLLPVLKRASDNNIAVITWDSDTDEEGRAFFINMVDPETLGRHLMDTLAWSTGERGKFAIMTGSLSAANLNEWMHWIKVQQQEYYPNMELVEIAANNDSYEEAYASAVRLLESHPDLAGIIGNSSVGPPSAAKAVKEAGKQGEVKVVGLSTPNLMRDALHDGTVQVITLWSPKRLGYLTVALGKNLLDGTLPYDGQFVNKVGNVRVKGDMVIMGEPLDFTKDNVDQYDF